MFVVMSVAYYLTTLHFVTLRKGDDTFVFTRDLFPMKSEDQYFLVIMEIRVINLSEYENKHLRCNILWEISRERLISHKILQRKYLFSCLRQIIQLGLCGKFHL